MDMIKGIKKRVGCFLLACSLSFGICATDYLEVQALEWAGTVIGLEEALKFLLGLIGVTVGVGVAENIDWQSMRENCVDFQIAQGQSAVAVSNWWADVIHGSLDTASQCWTSFKDWVKNVVLNSSGGTTTGGITLGVTTMAEAVPILCAAADIENPTITGTWGSSTFNAFYFYPSTQSFAFYVGDIPSVFSLSGNTLKISSPANKVYANIFNGQLNLIRNKYSSTDTFDLSNDHYIFVSDNFLNIPDDSRVIIYGEEVLPDFSDLASDFSNVQDIAIAPSIATDLPYEGVIDIPWENVGANEEDVAEAIDGAQEKVITGEWSLSQYWEWVQNVTNVFAYDITNNYLLPNDGSNEPADDKIQENINRGAFVLAGLEKVFPFCIPWDIYSFVTLLVAEPVAPVIEYPIYNPVTDSEEIITIDFSLWEQQVIIMRYIMDFLLIIGLLLLARSLIGAGGSD